MLTAKHDFDRVFTLLKSILQRHAAELRVKHDEPGNYYLETASPGNRGKPMFFGAVGKKRYVSFHLMPVYMYPDLAADISPALKKRMQGKSCFNFKAEDPVLFAELAALTSAGLERFRRDNLL